MLNADLRSPNVFLAELCRVLPVQVNHVPFPVAEMWESGWERPCGSREGSLAWLDSWSCTSQQRHNGSEISPVH